MYCAPKYPSKTEGGTKQRCCHSPNVWKIYI